MNFISRRKEMLETIKQYGVVNESVLKAMMQVERHLFIPEDLLSKAYGDYPLSIGYGQTISQPFIVAYMAELSEASKSLNILEIGCGSGYEAAVLANLYKQVYSIENIAALAESSSHLLQQLKYDNVSVIYGNGFLG
ncbi:MAG: protein-L-isoaspartate O-methyltransferase, partial [Leptospiraceae bacterium]|nr:protein-L-isoaspartate O-methyltransferase [Leptospiraceae bacterium]